MSVNPNTRILVVDDFATMRRIIKNVLKQIGFKNVDEAEDGRPALAKLNSNEYDLVISDWNMPNMDGLTLLKSVRGDDRLKDTPFIMVTAESQKENVIEAIKARVSEYVVKPFTSEYLTDKINRVLGG